MPVVLLFGCAVVGFVIYVAIRSSSTLTYKGTVFRSGDAVRIRKWAGTKKPERTGHSVEVDSGPGQTGAVLKKVKRPSGDDWLLLVRWDAQDWREYNTGGHKVPLKQFDDTIHPDYLEHATDSRCPQKLEADGKTLVEGQNIKLNKRYYVSAEKCGHRRGVYGRPGQQGTFFRGDSDKRAIIDWPAQAWEEDETGKAVHLAAFTSEINPRVIG